MATFEAQTMVDPNPGVNALYNAQQGQWIQNQTAQQTLQQRNQLFPSQLQEAQQKVGLTDWDAAARAGTALLGMSEDQAAAAYPGMLQGLRAEGFKLPDAPATYPGHAAIQAMVNRGMTVPQQYASGIIMPPGLADTLGRITGTQPPGPTAQTGSTSGGAPSTIEPAALTNASAVRDGLIKRGMDPETATAFAANALHESAANPNTGPGDAGASQGLFMWNGARNTAYQQLYGHTPQGAPLDEQLDFVMHELNGSESLAKDRINQAQGVDGKAAQVSEAYLRPKDTAPEMQRRSATALQLQRQLGGPATATATPATAPAGGGGAPGSYQVASNAPVPPPGSTAPGAPALLVPGSGGPGPRVAPALPVPGAAVAQNTLVPPAPLRPQVAAAAAAPPAAATPPATGVNSPQYQQAIQLQNQALQVETMYPNSPQAKAAAAALRLRAQQILQTDSVVQTPQGQLHTLTGKIDDPAKPLPHYVYDPTQHAYIDTTGTNKPEFEPAQRDSAVAQRDVMELGPLVANHTATPEQVARYNVAATTYLQPTLRENPVTKETVRVNTRELPTGFPEPPSLAGGGAPGGATAPGGSQVVMPGLSPAQQEIERDPAKAKVSDEQYGRDSKNVGDLTTGVMTAQNDNLRTKEMLDILNNGDFSTGPGSETRTRVSAWFQRWAPASLTGWEKQSTDLKGAAAAQAFQKLAFQGVTTQEKESSPRGGILATQLFQKNNPGLDLLDPANQSLLDMKLIQNQANIDYGRDALGHFTTQETRYGDTHKYSSLEQFNTQWVNQRNPQVYAAAMGAVTGQPSSQWAKGLSDDEYTRALQIVQRAKPSAVVQTKNGPYSMQPAAVTSGTSGKPGTTVIRFDHNGNVIQ